MSGNYLFVFYYYFAHRYYWDTALPHKKKKKENIYIYLDDRENASRRADYLLCYREFSKSILFQFYSSSRPLSQKALYHRDPGRVILEGEVGRDRRVDG